MNPSSFTSVAVMAYGHLSHEDDFSQERLDGGAKDSAKELRLS
jgi:hypothetical protein